MWRYALCMLFCVIFYYTVKSFTTLKQPIVPVNVGNTFIIDEYADYSVTVYYYKNGKATDTIKNVVQFKIRNLYDSDSIVSIPTYNEITIIETDILYVKNKNDYAK